MREGGTFKYTRGGKTKYGVKTPVEGDGWKYRYGFPTRKQASAEYRRLRHVIDSGGDPFPPAMSFRDYCASWLAHRRADGLRPTTVRRYEALLRDDVLPVVGHLELRRIKPAHVRTVLDNMTARGLSPRTVVQGRAVFGGVMKQAMRDGLVEVNPVSAIRRPKTARSAKAIPTPLQVKAVIEESRGTDVEIPLLLAATTGMRRSEVLGLQWADLDLKTNRLRVTRGLQWLTTGGGRKLEFTGLKTERARRTVQLFPTVAERLRHHRKAQTEQRLALGEAWQDHGLVCDRGDGAPIDPESFSKGFKSVALAAGLDPRTRLHDLRHAVATQLARKGVHPHTVSAILGHSSVAFTMDVYTEEWDEGAAQAATALGEALEL
ncbi:site-specific integrase [soil metagenome]